MREGSVAFERLSAVYDAAKGGIERGKLFADDVAPWLEGRAGVIVDIGVGTGAVALPLHLRVQRDVLGVDLSREMIDRAAARLGPGRVAVADAGVLPFPTGAVADALGVWLFQVVDDRAATMAEVARVLRPGGRFVVVIGHPERTETDVDALLPIWPTALGHAVVDHPSAIAGLAQDTGLTVVTQAQTAWQKWDSTPLDEVDRIERRTYTALLDCDDATWEAEVQPVIESLRTLDEPERPRRRGSHHPILVLEKPL